MSPTGPALNNTVSLAGTLGSGTINLTTLATSLTLTDTSEEDITADFYTVYTAIPDIDISDIPFMLLFTVNLMSSLDNLKKTATQPEVIPFDIARDVIENRRQEVEVMLNANNTWWNWGY